MVFIWPAVTTLRGVISQKGVAQNVSLSYALSLIPPFFALATPLHVTVYLFVSGTTSHYNVE